MGSLPLLLISGPIRQHLWKANVALVVLIVLVPVLMGILRRLPKEPTPGTGYSPLSGKWMRPMVRVLLVLTVLFILAILLTPLNFFVLFPGLAR